MSETREFRTLPHNIKIYRDGVVEQDGKVLRSFMSDGRYTTSVYDGKTRRWVATHRLIAEAWIGPTAGQFVLFRDGNKENLSADNLEIRPTRAASVKRGQTLETACTNG